MESCSTCSWSASLQQHRLSIPKRHQEGVPANATPGLRSPEPPGSDSSSLMPFISPWSYVPAKGWVVSPLYLSALLPSRDSTAIIGRWALQSADRSKCQLLKCFENFMLLCHLHIPKKNCANIPNHHATCHETFYLPGHSFPAGCVLQELTETASRDGLPANLRFFNKTHEVWTGRVAMLGFLGLVVVEIVLGRGLFV